MTDQNTIDRYIMGQMTAAEREDFEKLLSENEELREQVELESLMADGILAANLREQMQQLSEQDEEKKSGGRIISLNRFRMIAIAASIAALAVFFWQNQTGTAGVSFDGIYSADSGLPVVMGETDDKQFAEAMIAYKQGEYPSAQVAFNGLCQNQSNPQACYYYAQTLIQDQNWSEALNQLQSLNGTADESLQEKVDWHLAFVLHQLEEPQHQELLQQIANDDSHSFQTEARQVLSK